MNSRMSKKHKIESHATWPKKNIIFVWTNCSWQLQSIFTKQITLHYLLRFPFPLTSMPCLELELAWKFKFPWRHFWLTREELHFFGTLSHTSWRIGIWNTTTKKSIPSLTKQNSNIYKIELHFSNLHFYFMS